MPNRLVLFDIDGTLLTGAGAGRVAVVAALNALCGDVGHFAEGLPFGGKTDPQICREILTLAGWSPTAIDEVMAPLLAAYLKALAVALPAASSARMMPGIIPLLTALRDDRNVCLGLLTGNLAEGAALKLNHFGIGNYFALGAYGSDHHDRHQLPPIGVARARALTGIAHEGKQVVIIGDTQHDVACGQAIGVRAIAVATGAVSREDLAACQPDHLFDDLTQTREVLSAIRS